MCGLLQMGLLLFVRHLYMLGIADKRYPSDMYMLVDNTNPKDKTSAVVCYMQVGILICEDSSPFE